MKRRYEIIAITPEEQAELQPATNALRDAYQHLHNAHGAAAAITTGLWGIAHFMQKKGTFDTKTFMELEPVQRILETVKRLESEQRDAQRIIAPLHCALAGKSGIFEPAVTDDETQA